MDCCFMPDPASYGDYCYSVGIAVMTTPHRKLLQKQKVHVYVVLYGYDYEGHTLEAVYANLRAAKTHPDGGDRKVIRRMPILADAARNRAQENRRWTRVNAEHLRDLALRALSTPSEAREAALEEAAKVCEIEQGKYSQYGHESAACRGALQYAADVIRALKSAAPARVAEGVAKEKK